MSAQKEDVKKKIDRIINGHRMTDVLCAGMKLGVYELLAKKPSTALQTAIALETDLRGTEILLNALVAIELLTKKKGVFSLTPAAKDFLVPGGKQYMGNMVEHVMGMRNAWMNLDQCVASGKPFPKKSPNKQAAKERQRAFILAMEDHSRGPARQLAEILDLKNVSRALDVGGGPGNYLFEVLKKAPGATGDVFDIPMTLEITDEVIRRHGMEKRVGMVSGDFLKDDIGKGYDLVIMSSILHIYSPAQNQMIVKKGFRALNPGGQLVIREFVLDPDGTSPVMAAIFSVNMLVNTDGGSSYTEAEMKSWMKNAGFEKLQRKDTPPHSTLIIGRKPDKKNAAKKKK